ncbi:metalloregulator ArsR/SmtB family transcription factor [Rhizobium sp. L1K21]|uniref:helix-turn-helix transcriptional regulator n=1 Tax=Rhizobium sp. L1K21 TaxID=2954933 RepID=UPI002091FFC6|nr:MarR family transcriptional regulator [Rhizobium sp. L1K21]MCO6187664.1 MarR family transcriptional regulator [Rhizobium sp. L1K21]
MSSSNLENYEWSPRNPSERVLLMMKMYGALTASEIGGKLDITGEAARQQLQKLVESGFVSEERRGEGRGRPSSYFDLTEKGQARFPDTHAALTIEILEGIREVLGPSALDKVITRRERSAGPFYKRELAKCRSFEERVSRLAELRSAEGYMAQAKAAEGGGMLLIENHCPICAAATLCQGFCRAELALFEQALGPDTEIERLTHIVEGGQRCTYLIREVQ